MSEAAAPANRYNRTPMIVLVACAALALGLFAYFRLNWHPYSIPSGSMEPTLLVGDHMLAENGPFGAKDIRRGEVIVFLNRENVNYVSRMVGVGGDVVRMIEGRLYLNEKAVPVADKGDFENAELPGDGARLIEETLDGRTYGTLDTRHGTAGDDTALFTVPDGHVFVMGDNRDNSNDSRFKIGFVPVDRIVGIARTIYWSPKRGGLGPYPVR